MFVICVNHSSSCRAANAGVFILNDLLPLNRLPLNKAHAIILSSCLTVSIEGIGGKVFGGGSPQLYYHDCSGRIPGRLREVLQRLQLGGFSLQQGVFSFYCMQKKIEPTKRLVFIVFGFCRKPCSAYFFIPEGFSLIS